MDFQPPDREGSPPRLSGYRTLRLLGTGRSASVWLVEKHGTGELLAAKCLTGERRPAALPCVLPAGGQPTTLPAGGGGMEAGERLLLQEVQPLNAYQHGHLLRLRGVAQLDGEQLDGGQLDGDLQGGAPPAGWTLLMDYAAGGSLGALLSARRVLTVGETVTILTPLFQVLAYLHRMGTVHGDVAPGNVLFSGQGKPLLADVGARWVAGVGGAGPEGTPGSPAPAVSRVCPDVDTAEDVYGAAALGWLCLTGGAPDPERVRVPLSRLRPDVPPELAAALEAGLQEVAGRRPPAGLLAQAVFRSAPAEPVNLSLSANANILAEPPTRRELRAGHRREARWNTRMFRGRTRLTFPGLAATCLAATGLALAAVLLGLLLPPPTALRSPPAGLPSTASTDGPGMNERERLLGSADPGEALQGLAGLRSAVLMAGTPDSLDRVNASGSRAAAADRDLLARLSLTGHRLDGIHTTVRDVQLLGSSDQDQANVLATVQFSGYRELSGTGQPVRTVADDDSRRLLFVLHREAGVWKIADVRWPG